MRKTILTLTTIAVTSLFAAAPASYNKCVSCHGANGEKVALGKSKIIKDMTKDEISLALNGYKDGTYGGVMKGIMKGQVTSLTDTDISDISNFIGK